jgi:Mg2+ and Co2+ transporter CorA
MASEMQLLVQDSESLGAQCEQLMLVHRSGQDERRNSVLYLLTVLSAMAIPLNFLTGYFGMNFNDMIELDPTKAHAEGYRVAGVKLFWLILCVIIAFVLIVAMRFLRADV